MISWHPDVWLESHICQPEVKNGGVSLLGYLGLLMPWDLKRTSTRRWKEEEWLLMTSRWRFRFFSPVSQLSRGWGVSGAWSTVGKLPAQMEEKWHSGCKGVNLTFPITSSPPPTLVSSVTLIGFDLLFQNYKFIKILKNCHHKKKHHLQLTVSTCCCTGFF